METNVPKNVQQESAVYEVTWSQSIDNNFYEYTDLMLFFIPTKEFRFLYCNKFFWRKGLRRIAEFIKKHFYALGKTNSSKILKNLLNVGYK